MGFKKLFTGFFVTLALYVLLIQRHQHVLGAPSNTNADGTHRPRSRPLVRIMPRLPSQYAKLKPDFTDFIVDDDDLFELSKRQTSDDYGHLRFGKRGEEQFDDYGHMRFGRSGGSE